MGTLIQYLVALCISTPCTFVTKTEPFLVIACTTQKTYDGQNEHVRNNQGKDVLIIQHRKCKSI